MVVSWKNFPIKKYRGEGFLAKKRRFLQFSIAAPKKISSGCQSDNFDPRRSAYCSHGQTVDFRPHSVIHIRKAEHLTIPKIRFKVNFRHPMKRQIF
jgi:hypothetical protein